MAESITSFIVAQISKKLITEWKSLPGLGTILEGFRAQLEQLGGLLRDADARKTDNDIIGQCVAEIREIASEAEDLLDRYAFQVGTARDNALSRCVYVSSKSRLTRKVELEIGRLKTKLSELRQGLVECGVKRDPVEDEGTSYGRWRPTSLSFCEEDDFIGFEDDVDLLVRLLVTEDDKTVYSIVFFILGMGGSGKTTLATKVYNHRIVRRHFTRFAWVRVSEQFRPQVVLKRIMVQLFPERRLAKTLQVEEESELRRQLYRLLSREQSRCLIVLDDICQTYDFVRIEDAVPSRHKILVTTDSHRVADTIYRVELQPLTLKESWKLLRLKALRERSSEESKKMEKLGMEFVGLCGDLPLDALILGGILATKTTFSEWKTLYEEISNNNVIPLRGSSSLFC